MAWLEGSALGHLMRDSGVWFYGIVNLTHILGVATLFGSVILLDLRLIGVWRDVPLKHITRPAMRMAAGGFCVAANTKEQNGIDSRECQQCWRVNTAF